MKALADLERGWKTLHPNGWAHRIREVPGMTGSAAFDFSDVRRAKMDAEQ